MKIIARIFIFLACIFAAIVSIVWMIPTAFSNGSRFLRIAVGFDSAASACFGGDGHTTISKRAYLAMQSGKRWGCVLCKLLDSIQKDHCENA